MDNVQTLKIYENTPTIETKNLVLRKFTLEDTEDMLRILSDEDVNKYLPWFVVKTKSQAQKHLEEHFINTYKNPYGYRYAICLKEDNKPIGYVNMSTGDSHDFGYGLLKEFWNKGIVTEASLAVVDRIKNSGLDYITATHDVNNIGSGAVMKKLGMKYCYTYEERCQPKDVVVFFRMYQLNFDDNKDRVYMEYYNKYENHFVEKDV